MAHRQLGTASARSAETLSQELYDFEVSLDYDRVLSA